MVINEGRVESTLAVIFSKDKLAYFKVRGLGYLLIICWFCNPVFCKQLGMEFSQLPQLMYCYLHQLVCHISIVVLAVA